MAASGKKKWGVGTLAGIFALAGICQKVFTHECLSITHAGNSRPTYQPVTKPYYQKPLTTISNGFGFILNRIFPRSDVIIFSDIDHRLSSNEYSDLFSAKKISDYAKLGVTDIFLENLETLDYAAKDLYDGKILKEEFIKTVLDNSTSIHMTAKAYEKKINNIADIIITCSKQSPRIRVHLSQIGNTPEQLQEMDVFLKPAKDCYSEALQNSMDLNNAIFKSGITLKKEQIGKIIDISSKFFVVSGRTTKEINPEEDIAEIIELCQGKEILKPFLDKFLELKRKQMGFLDRKDDLFCKFRVENDVILAKKIQDDNGGGKIIVCHGAGHGATSKNDLDEYLQKAGFITSRINIAYYTYSLQLYQTNNERTDPSEVSYLPDMDTVEIRDLDENGKINGLTTERVRFSSIHTSPLKKS